ncbi:hypothetical protein [Embleya scabrispora]|nr:hypothetical protein [Embleya scabrispora]
MTLPSIRRSHQDPPEPATTDPLRILAVHGLHEFRRHDHTEAIRGTYVTLRQYDEIAAAVFLPGVNERDPQVTDAIDRIDRWHSVLFDLLSLNGIPTTLARLEQAATEHDLDNEPAAAREARARIADVTARRAALRESIAVWAAAFGDPSELDGVLYGFGPHGPYLDAAEDLRATLAASSA